MISDESGFKSVSRFGVETAFSMVFCHLSMHSATLTNQKGVAHIRETTPLQYKNVDANGVNTTDTGSKC